MNWKKKLQIWVESGLISKDQSEAILHFENSKRVPYAFYSFLGVGIVVLGLGVLAIVAANWDKIHYSLKLFVAFASLFAIGFLILYSGRKGIWNDTIRYLLVLLFSVLLFANIGLISQVYHTQGKLYQGLLLWSGITILLVILFPGKVLQHLWISVFSFSFFSWILSGADLEWKEEEYFLSLTIYWFAWIFSGISIFAEKRMETKGNQNFLMSNPFLLWAFGYFLVASIWGSYATQREEYLEDFRSFSNPNILHSWYLPFLLPVLLLGLGVLFRTRFSKRKLFLLFLSGVFLSLLNFPNLTHWHGKLPSAVYFFGAWLPFAFLFFESRRWFDLSLFVLGLRFVAVYLEVFGSLLETGIGLIVSGILILGFSILFFKLKEKIREKANLLFPLEDEA
ncbi:DUF2157 domain-containing protein [Leptospira wolffii]|uniref:DUF2157 domain-containing protein n=1 Tax=Leptospira wolffii TaxID=409998 RepID=UPI00108254D2|nr:DUF2157 domain-containing protein [Leptospira wolffii]TGK56897.1 DUF2157 domain-containing protein [Leptospira wolffii]TGK71521.1 DUF2157 domain-containing protein [Leptospira wolffii]TGK75623.1 DUF2157 domain-containing protein [Leptospira wolffii]TGL32888.1 DUF2157 domain-containing protein [Leptospira wolffii]